MYKSSIRAVPAHGARTVCTPPSNTVHTCLDLVLEVLQTVSSSFQGLEQQIVQPRRRITKNQQLWYPAEMLSANASRILRLYNYAHAFQSSVNTKIKEKGSSPQEE